MNIQLFNTLSRTKEIFKPVEFGTVSMYHCGPTVYDSPHIGNHRTFIMNDILRRVFEYNDYKIQQVMNVTDVDDKTIKRSIEENIKLAELTKKYEEIFIDNLLSLNIKIPEHLTRATEYIDEMIELINTLIEKEIAYIANDGVYVSIDKVKSYGKLAKLDLSNISKERIINDDYDKANPRDFTVWKFKSNDDGEVFWDAPFGAGRPGWHIECSAMSMKLLGPTIDIHTGAIDLIFPHHTNEIAQSESATGKQFVNYWIHGAFINFQEEKMSKSKNNFYKLQDLEEEMISPLSFRYWLLTAHYRSPVNFTFEAIRGAQNALIRFMHLIRDFPNGGNVIKEYQERFKTFINDDMNTPQAIALSWELVKDTNHSNEDKRATLIDFDRVLGLKLDTVPKSTEDKIEIPPEIHVLVQAREEARQKKDWEQADALRLEIEARGYNISDTPSGIKIIQI